MKQIQEDRIISEFLRSLGPWREFVVIGGGFALFIYKMYLADSKLENPPVGTRDVDSQGPHKPALITARRHNKINKLRHDELRWVTLAVASFFPSSA